MLPIISGLISAYFAFLSHNYSTVIWAILCVCWMVMKWVQSYTMALLRKILALAIIQVKTYEDIIIKRNIPEDVEQTKGPVTVKVLNKEEYEKFKN